MLNGLMVGYYVEWFNGLMVCLKCLRMFKNCLRIIECFGYNVELKMKMQE
jgi:hypothetical protein